MLLSLVVPCYNEEGNVEKLFSETNIAFAGKDFEYEFVFVNDGSRDKTGQCLKTLFDENKNHKTARDVHERTHSLKDLMQICSKDPRLYLRCWML